jgi:cholesterol transport system auxiliary component
MSPHLSVPPARAGSGAVALQRVGFAAVLALGLAGCSLLGGSKSAPTRYAPQPRVQADPSWPSVDWQLTLAAVQVARPVDSARIAVRPAPQELQVYKDATWAQRPAEMVERTLLRLLEDSGRIPGVARAGSGVNADYRLLLDVRRFESDYAGGASPQAVIEINAKLLHAQDADVVATRSFVQAAPAGGTAVPQVVDAFERGLGAISREIAGWTLASGQSHEGGAHR